MTTSQTTVTPATKPACDLQQQIRARIDSLSYLPTTAAVAIKFVELGKNPDAEPADYAKVISADSSLSTKLLALANSSWAGVRSRVTTGRMAVNLLGVGTVRTLAISYCMTGLHNELRLTPAESEAFWETSLSKAVAAKQYAAHFDAKLADEAFVAGLFQDFALPVMYAVARESYLALLQNPQIDVPARLQLERDMFGTDHTEIGRALAQKLELPEVFVDTVAFHHNYERLNELVRPAALGDATFAAGALPHALNVWNEADARALEAFLQQHTPDLDMAGFIAAVQVEFNQLFSFFNEGNTPQTQLADLLANTAREAADNTTALVTTMSELLHEAAAGGPEMVTRVRKLENEVNRDQLTGVLNRSGLTAAGERFLVNAARYGIGFAVGYLDVDKFKALNDSFGHAFGDVALQTIVARTNEKLPGDAVVGRMGGDEFVLLFNVAGREDAVDTAEQIVRAIAATSVSDRGVSAPVRASIGLLYATPSTTPQRLDALINAADQQMYQAKHGGGNRVETRVI